MGRRKIVSVRAPVNLADADIDAATTTLNHLIERFQRFLAAVKIPALSGHIQSPWPGQNTAVITLPTSLHADRDQQSGGHLVYFCQQPIGAGHRRRRTTR